MNNSIPYNGEYGKFESSTYTRSYINRHHAVATQIFKKYVEEQKWGLLYSVEEMIPIIEKHLKQQGMS